MIFATGGGVNLPSISTVQRTAGGSNEKIQIALQDPSGMMTAIANKTIRTSAGTIVQIAVEQSRRVTKSEFAQNMTETQGRVL